MRNGHNPVDIFPKSASARKNANGQAVVQIMLFFLDVTVHHDNYKAIVIGTFFIRHPPTSDTHHICEATSKTVIFPGF